MKKTIFVTDDSLSNLTMVAATLSPHYTVRTIPSGEKTVKLLEKQTPDLMLLDIEMPQMSGFDVLKVLKENEKYKHIPVIFLTASSDFAVEVEALEMGVADFITKPFNPAVLLNRVRHQIDISSIIEERTKDLFKAKQDIVFIMAEMVENRDESTGDHIGRTSKLIKALLLRMMKTGTYTDLIKDWDFDLIAGCSQLHDVGKINTPDVILKKPDKLTGEEWEVMKDHAAAGGRIIEKIIQHSGENVFLYNSKQFAVYHHERWNGTGYPFGLAGEEIPLHGRIMAIVDVFDALVSKRAYKDAFTTEQAISIMKEERGQHFDPKIVDIFVDIYEEICTDIYGI